MEQHPNDPLHGKTLEMILNDLVEYCKGHHAEDIDGVVLTPEQLESAKEKIRDCRICLAAKNTRNALGRRGLEIGNYPFEVLHLDTYTVVFDESSHEYSVVLKDRSNGWRDSICVHNKSEIPFRLD